VEDAGCCVGSPDETGSQGTSADDEVAVVGNSRSECRSVRGMNRNRGHRRRDDAVVGGAAGEPAGAWLSDAAVAVAVAERNVRGTFGSFAVPGRRRRPSDRHPRPSDLLHPGRDRERDPPPSPFGA